MNSLEIVSILKDILSSNLPFSFLNDYLLDFKIEPLEKVIVYSYFIECTYVEEFVCFDDLTQKYKTLYPNLICEESFDSKIEAEAYIKGLIKYLDSDVNLFVAYTRESLEQDIHEYCVALNLDQNLLV